jgi:hypothetical protein
MTGREVAGNGIARLRTRVLALGRTDGLRRLIRHGPFAMAASSLPGAVNYVAILYLTYLASAAETGRYRLLFSWFALYGLASVYESNKVFIRSIAEGDKSSTVGLFVTQVLFSGVTFLVTLAVWAVSVAMHKPIPGELVWIALLALVFYPTNSYQSYYQVKSWFMLFFVSELAKYGVALVVLLGMLHLGFSIVQSVLAQFAVMAAFHLVYFSFSVATFIDWSAIAGNWREMLMSPASREAQGLSLANFLPSTLEHVDKMIIGAVFGLQTLGLYTLGFSTGRFIYNALKPALYIYYKRFVSRLPTQRLLWVLGIGFSAFGALLSIGFLVVVAHVPALAPFRGTQMVTVILFLSYGIGMVDAVYLQAYSINKDTQSGHILIANTIASVACLGMFGVAALLTGPVALALFALHYPLRHGLSVGIVSLLSRRRLQAAG